MKKPQIKYHLLILLFCSFTISAHTQTIQEYVTRQYAKLDTTKFPKLTHVQMLEDYDFFMNTIRKTFPSTYVKKKVENNNILSTMLKLREEITPQMSTGMFYSLLEKAAYSCQNAHTGIGVLYSSKQNKIARINQDFLIYLSGHQRFFNLNLEFCYIKGKYYNVIPFERDGVVFEKEWQLVGCNGHNINEFVQGLMPYIMLKWDVENEQYYDPRFYRSSNLQQDSLRLVFEDMGGQLHYATFLVSERVDLIDTVRNTANNMQARFFDDRQILYLRIPRMNNLNPNSAKN